jgi:hypothetical protein
LLFLIKRESRKGERMKILIIDGQGGRLGSQLVRIILERFPDVGIMAVGTNSIAAAAMKKSGAAQAATGENAVRVACRKADVIIGPIGVVIADSLCGEVTPAMATAVGQADAVRILLPVSRCQNLVAGIRKISTTALLEDVVQILGELRANP